MQIYSNQIPRFQGEDDIPLVISQADISQGSNSRMDSSRLPDNQAKVVYNIDLGIPGQTTKRPGMFLIKAVSGTAGGGIFGFEPDGGTNELLICDGPNLRGATTLDLSLSGNTTFTVHKSNFTPNLATTMFKAGMSAQGDIVMISNGTDNWFLMEQDHTMLDLSATAGTGSDSPPKSTVGTYYRNRVWILTENLLYFSDAYPANYSVAFDTVANAFRMPVGTERAITGIRDSGMLIIGNDQVWALNPSITPAPDTDKPEKILDIGCAAGDTCRQVGDDVLFLAYDGVRGVFRTQQDKVQLGTSFPLSYPLKDEFDTINWAQITKACAEVFDNKYFISLPTGSATYNNQIWIYWPATQGWMVLTGWNIAKLGKLKYDGEEILVGVDATTGKVYHLWTGYDDVGTGINYQEESKSFDMGQPLIKKCGGEVVIKVKAGGNYDMNVYSQFDNGGWDSLGVINFAGNLITFPTSFPINFESPNILTQKYHIIGYGPWYNLRLKLQHTGANTQEMTVLERQVITYPREYHAEK